MSGRPPPVEGLLSVLGEYRGLLFVDKPAGLQTEPDVRHDDTLVTRIARQLALPRERIHALSRLDTGVSGVVTLGLTSEARKLVLDWRRQGLFSRRYVALATGEPTTSAGAWRESIGRGTGNLRRVGGRQPEEAESHYAVIARSSPSAGATPQALVLLALSPRTGRTHQLRVHAAAHGLPLLGDRAYGGSARLIAENGSVRAFERIALHAAWVELPLPEPLRFNAEIPDELAAIWRDFGGDPAGFERARSAELGVHAGGSV